MLGVYGSHLRRGSIAILFWCSKVVNDMNGNIFVSVNGYTENTFSSLLKWRTLF